jgi:hypothetical protein
VGFIKIFQAIENRGNEFLAGGGRYYDNGWQGKK